MPSAGGLCSVVKRFSRVRAGENEKGNLMSTFVSILHASSNLYLGVSNGEIALQSDLYLWEIYGTDEDATEYTFCSPFATLHGGYLGSASGDLFGQSQDLAVVNDDGFIFNVSSSDWGGPNTGYPVQVTQGGPSMFLCVDASKPVLEKDFPHEKSGAWKIAPGG